MEHAFFDFWRERFPNTPPISSVVRNNHLDRWLRRHALPKSKRYADTPEEVAEILYRANALGDALFQHQPDCWLVKASYTATLNPKLGSLGLEYAFDLAPSETEGAKVSVYGVRTRWAAGAFNDVLREIADEEIYSLIWVSRRGRESGAAHHNAHQTQASISSWRGSHRGEVEFRFFGECV